MRKALGILVWAPLLSGCGTIAAVARGVGDTLANNPSPAAVQTATDVGHAVGTAVQVGASALPEPWHSLVVGGIALIAGVAMKVYHQHLLDTPVPPAAKPAA